MKRILFRVSAVILSFLFIFLVLEISIRLVYKFRFQQKGNSPVPASKTYRLSENRQLLYEFIPNSRARIKGIEYEINAFGFRDKKYRERKTSEKRIIFVGDSLTYGWCLPLEETYHKQLEELMDSKGYDIDVMGMGVVGYNTVQEYHLIKENTFRFDPDMVILQLCPNDFERTVGIKKTQNQEKYILIPYHDFSIPYIFKKRRVTQFFMKNSHLYRFINLKFFWLKKKLNKDYTPQEVFLLGEEKAFQHLEKIKNYLDKKNIPFSVVIFPFRKIGEVYPYASINKKLLEWLERMNVPYLDLYGEFNSKDREEIWIDRLHLNATGNEIAANRLFDFIVPLLYDKII